MTIGIFDSGIGGEAVAKALQQHFPEAAFTVVNDRAHLPYGDRSVDDIRQLTNAAIQPLLGSDVIVIACNTATAAAIDWLRQTYPTQKFIGIEPMILPAVKQTTTGIIAVCATPATLASDRYKQLKASSAANITVIEPDCSAWARMIEDNNINESQIANQITSLLEQGVDVIVLGCTHYHWIQDLIESIARNRALILEPSPAIAARVETLLADNI